MKRTKKWLVGLLATLSVFCGSLGLAACGDMGDNTSIGQSSTTTSSEHKHNFGVWKEIVPSTCMQEGEERRSCIICGEEEIRALPMITVHTYDETGLCVCGKKVSVGLTYKLLAEGYSVTGIGSCQDENLSIPEIHEGKPVVSIESRAFQNCTHLLSVIVPNSVNYIWREAFSGCNNLKELTIPFVGVSRNPDEIEAQKEDFGGSEPKLYDAVFGYIFEFNGGVQYGFSANGIPQFDTGRWTYYYDIPESIKTVHITDDEQISEKAFSGCFMIKEMALSDTTLQIGDLAFYKCSGLTSIEISNSVTSIGNSAFSVCNSLTSIEIPDSVTSIGNSVFYGCHSLTSIEIPDSVTSIGDYAFSGCSSLKYNIKDKLNYLGNEQNPYLCLVSISDKSITNAKIENTCKIIAFEAFSSCSSLTSVTIPNSVASIENSAFSGCTGLTSITLPDSVTSIGDSVFANCANLTSITLPDSVTSIGDYAFSGCNSLTNIICPAFVISCMPKNNLEAVAITSGTIGVSLLNGCTGLMSITIGDNVTFLGDSVFENCANLTSIIVSEDNMSYASQDGILYNKEKTNFVYIPRKISGAVNIPYGITSIGFNAFSERKNLTSITIPDSVTSIGSEAFFGCIGLTDITIPDSVTSIGYDAFSNCNSLTNIVCPTFAISHMSKKILQTVVITSGESIGRSLFYGCSNLKSIEIPNSVMSIDNSAFYECSSLTSIIIPDSVTSIGDYAFYNCRNLTNITIPDGVTSIGVRSFANCYSLTSAKIPDSVTSIGSGVFSDCSVLTEIICPAFAISYISKTKLKTLVITSGDSIEERAFLNCSSLTSVTIGDSVTSIGSGAFSGCRSLASIEIPNSVTSIEKSAFYGCSSLKNITFNGTTEEWNAIGKGSFWNHNVPATKVVCSDGGVEI